MTKWVIGRTAGVRHQFPGQDTRGCLYVEGLSCGRSHNTLLIVRYPAGDRDQVREDGDELHNALYDLYQTEDRVKVGDTFQLDGKVLYRCDRIHVVPYREDA